MFTDVAGGSRALQKDIGLLGWLTVLMLMAKLPDAHKEANKNRSTWTRLEILQQDSTTTVEYDPIPPPLT